VVVLQTISRAENEHKGLKIWIIGKEYMEMHRVICGRLPEKTARNCLNVFLKTFRCLPNYLHYLIAIAEHSSARLFNLFESHS